jgi:hypothetical protein
MNTIGAGIAYKAYVLGEFDRTQNFSPVKYTPQTVPGHSA